MLLALMLSVGTSIPSQTATELKIVHINVGQGDATLILGPPDSAGDRVSVLIDAGDIPMGGDKDGGSIVLETLTEHGITELDHFIVTHYDADHIGGAITGSLGTHGHSFILGPNNTPGDVGDDDGDGKDGWLDGNKKRKPDPEELGTGDDIRVLHFVDRGGVSTPSSATFKKYEALASLGTRTSIEDRSDVESFSIDLGGTNPSATLRCLAANGFVSERATRVAKVNTENERSLCFLLRYGGFDYLIAGDLIGRQHGSENAEVEAAVGAVLAAHDMNIDVLHVNHHGANNGSEESFLDFVVPEVAIISAGNGNSHKHPHFDALERLVDAGVSRIYSTEWGTTKGTIPSSLRLRHAIFQGDVVLTTNGTEYFISTTQRFATDDIFP